MRKRKIKSYKTIFFFETLILLIYIINCLNSKLLNIYALPLSLLIIDFLFFLILGFEKENKRLRNEISFDLFMYSTIFLLLYYLLGIIIGFAQNNNYLTLYGVTLFIIPTLLTIIFKEHLRKSLLTKCGSNKFLIAYTFLVFIMIDISTTLSILNYKNVHDVFIFIVLTLLPSITTNILATYINIKVGYQPIIIYLLIITMYQYILPIVPNPNQYLKSIIDFLLPIVILFKIIKKINQYSLEEEEISRDYHKKRFFTLAIPFVLIFSLVYLVSGYFKYYALAIASGSMHPVFNRGSVVIVERTDDKYDNYNKLTEGEIIAYKCENSIVVHRLIRIVETKDETFYYTKGDANKNEDNYPIKKENIIGIVRVKLPYIGYPTVWFSEI